LDFNNPVIWAQADALNQAAGITSNFAGSASDLNTKFYPLMTAACVFLFVGVPLIVFVVPVAISLALYAAGFALVAGSPFLTASNYQNSIFPSCTVTVDTYGQASGWDAVITLLAFLAWCTVFPFIAVCVYCLSDSTPGSVAHPGHEEEQEAAVAAAAAANKLVADGTALEVEYDGVWLPATVVKCNDDDGTLNVTYADGNEERNVTKDRARLPGTATPLAAPVPTEKGKSVQHFMVLMHHGLPTAAAGYVMNPIKRGLSARGYAVTHTSGRCAHCPSEDRGRLFCTPSALRSHTLAKHPGKDPLFLEDAGADEAAATLNYVPPMAAPTPMAAPQAWPVPALPAPAGAVPVATADVNINNLPPPPDSSGRV